MIPRRPPYIKEGTGGVNTHKKILSIIIPYCNETRKELFIPLSGIYGQVGIRFENIECILVNDGGNNVLPADFLSLFAPLPVRVIYLPENIGPGPARQAGIEAADGEYVMFCDVDDTFHNVLVLKTFTEEISRGHAELMYSGIIIEEYDKTAKTYSYLTHDAMIQVLHGKAYRKAWLTDNSIRFHERLRCHEDTYFNNLAYTVCAREKDIRRIDIVSYMQRYRPGSLTRRDETDYFIETMPEMIACSGYLCDEVETRRPERLQAMVTEYILYFYFMLHTKKWDSLASAALREQSERMFKDRILSRICCFKTSSTEAIAALYHQMRQKYFSGELETELLTEWLDRLQSAPCLI